MNIGQIYNISNTNGDAFLKSLQASVNDLQDKGYEVEVQYSTNVNEYLQGGIAYSALLIGRK